MLAPPVPVDEQSRLEKLRVNQLLYSPMEARFDALTRMAREDFKVPIVLITLIGKEVQWVKSAVGLAEPEAPRCVSFCAHAIDHKDLFIVEDATKDERFFDNPLVTGSPHIVFYAGVPLRLGDGSGLGALCLIDHKPRTLSSTERMLLRAMGRLVSADLAEALPDQLESTFLQDLGGDEKCAEALDPLTRTWGANALEQLFDRAMKHQTEPPPGAVVSLGPVSFEQLHSTLSAAELDEVILEVSSRIREWLCKRDFFGHVGSGEFVIVLRGPRLVSFDDLANVIRDEVNGKPVDGKTFSVDFAAIVGCVKVRDDSHPEYSDIVRKAVLAKESGRFLSEPVLPRPIQKKVLRGLK